MMLILDQVVTQQGLVLAQALGLVESLGLLQILNIIIMDPQDINQELEDHHTLHLALHQVQALAMGLALEMAAKVQAVHTPQLVQVLGPAQDQAMDMAIVQLLQTMVFGLSQKGKVHLMDTL